MANEATGKKPTTSTTEHQQQQRNKYLFREKCFLCQKDNPNPLDMSDIDDDHQSAQFDFTASLNGGGGDSAVDKNSEIIRLFGLNPNPKKFKKFPLWTCVNCMKSCENEEKKKKLLKLLGKKMPETNLDFFNIEIKKPIVLNENGGGGGGGASKKTTTTTTGGKITTTTTTTTTTNSNGQIHIKSTIKSINHNNSLNGVDTSGGSGVADDACSCKGCKDRRLIEEQEELHHTLINSNWKELRHFIRCVYRQTGTSVTNFNSKEELEKYRGYARRLILYEAHKLYIQIQDEVKDYLNETNQRLIKQLRKSLKTQNDAYTFILLLLDEYESMCQASRLVSNILSDLEQDHLKRFHITWELDNKNLFRIIIYENELVQNSIPNLFELLKNKDTSSDAQPSGNVTPPTNTKLYTRFINFIEEMNVINAVWSECKQLLDKYEQEQRTIFKLKEEMLKKDYEFYKICRKLIKDKLKSNDKLNEFLNAKKSKTADSTTSTTAPPSSQTLHCTCDECTIKNLIICGILDTDFIMNGDTCDAGGLGVSTGGGVDGKDKFKIQMHDHQNENNKKSIENAAAAVALAAAAALNFDKTDSDDEDDDEDDDDFDGELEEDEDDDDVECDDSESDLNDSDSDLDDEDDIDVDDGDDDDDDDIDLDIVHNELSKKIDLDTLNKFKLCKNLYNLQLKFEKDKKFKVIPDAAASILTAKLNEHASKQRCGRKEGDVSKIDDSLNGSPKGQSGGSRKKLKQSAGNGTTPQASTKTTTTTTTTSSLASSSSSAAPLTTVSAANRRLYHIYEAEITEEKKYILSENELIEAIKEYRMSQRSMDIGLQQHGEQQHGTCNGEICGNAVCGGSTTAAIEDDQQSVPQHNPHPHQHHHHHHHHHHVQHHSQHTNGSSTASNGTNCSTCCHCCSPPSPTSSTTTQTLYSLSPPPPPHPHHMHHSHSQTIFSKNFIEIRERLRKKCFKKKETVNGQDAPQQSGGNTATASDRNRSVSSSSSTATTTATVMVGNGGSGSVVNPVSTLDIDSLVKYINGDTQQVANGGSKSAANNDSSKKQKQKKQKQNQKPEKEKQSEPQSQQSVKKETKKTASQQQLPVAKPPQPQQSNKNGGPLTQKQEQQIQSQKQEPQQLEQKDDKNKSKKAKKSKGKKNEVNGNSVCTNADASDIHHKSKNSSNNKENANDSLNAAHVECNDDSTFTLNTIEKIFMPRNDIENLTETEKEIEEFKRFCFECKPINEREKVKFNMPPIISKSRQTPSQLTV